MRIGRELLPAGRSMRAVAGVLFLAAAFGSARSSGLTSAPALAQAVLTVLLCAALYTALVWVLGERFLARTDPWLAALVLILPLAIVGMVPSVPGPIAIGVDLYVALSLLVQAAIGYGGCEIAGVPTLLLSRRYTVYCAFNGVDVVERWLRTRSPWMGWGIALLAFVVTTAVMAVALTIGSGLGFWAAYLLFLVSGLLANSLVVWRRRHAERPSPPIDGTPSRRT